MSFVNITNSVSSYAFPFLPCGAVERLYHEQFLTEYKLDDLHAYFACDLNRQF